MSNALKTTLLLGLLTGLLMWVGQLVGGMQGLVLGLVLAAVMNLGSYWFSDRIVLAVYGARQLGEQEAPDLFRVVRELAAGAHMPMPRVYLIASDSPNAFATGRSPEHAAVAVTAGIMRLLTPDELRGVLAHELSHVPRSLASALEKLGAASGRVPLPAGPATAHLWIVNPLRGNWLASLFSTHPPIEERIRRLRAMAY